MTLGRRIAALLLLASGLSGPAQAGMTQDEIARATQNPLTAMYSLPIQNNTYFGMGPQDRTRNVANLQPVIPVHLNDDWTLVTRTIVPLISAPSFPELTPDPGDAYTRTNGIGDTTFTAFFTPSRPDDSGWLWGVGPVLYLPTASDEALGTDKWGLGPAGVALKMQGKWVYGALLMNVRSVAGSGQDEGVERVDLMTFQPFVNYNLSRGWFVASVPIITADWTADSDHRWTVPVGLGVGKAMRLGKYPLTVQVHGYYNAVTPDDYGEQWQLRLQAQILLPRR